MRVSVVILVRYARLKFNGICQVMFSGKIKLRATSGYFASVRVTSDILAVSTPEAILS